VDNDGRPEVLFGRFNGDVFALNGESGSVLWTINLGATSYIQSEPSIADLDGNGQLDLVVTQWSGNHRVYALRGNNGSVLWYSDATTDWMYHGASIADLDEDGKPRSSSGATTPRCERSRGVGRARVGVHRAYYVGAPTSVADLNGDGHLEVAYKRLGQGRRPLERRASRWTYDAGNGIFADRPSPT